MPDLAVWLEAQHGVVVDPSNLSKFLCGKGFTYKKNAAGIGARTLRCEGGPGVNGAIAASPSCVGNPRGWCSSMKTSVKTNMTPLRGRSLRGRAAAGRRPLRQMAHADLHRGLALSRTRRAVGHRGSDGRPGLRRVRAHATGAVSIARRRRDYGQSQRSQEPKSRAGSCRARCLAACCCRNTRPISIPSKWPSPSSRRSCERQRPEPPTTSGAPSVTSAPCSSQTSAGIISRPTAMLQNNRPTL